MIDSIDDLLQRLQGVGYFADRRLATAAFLALKLQRPLLLEGEPGVGKTELAKALAQVLGRELLRLQCYDGLEHRDALYEWNYPAQLLRMRAVEGTETAEEIEREVYQPRYLIKRPLLQALQSPPPGALLLVDEVDRADEPFEAFLLEYLGEYQVSIPELGVVRALVPPVTILTSNRTRELHDAVKRRCLYHWLDYPDRERELAIVRARVPQLREQLAKQVADFIARLRSQPCADAFQRLPGIAETIDWIKALTTLDVIELDPDTINDTLGALLKYQDDIEKIRGSEARRLLAEVNSELSAAAG